MHIYKIYTLLSFYEEICTFFIDPKVLIIETFCFYVQIYISIYFDNLVRFFFDYLVKNRWVIPWHNSFLNYRTRIAN